MVGSKQLVHEFCVLVFEKAKQGVTGFRAFLDQGISGMAHFRRR
jgi:hypothetical protein